MSTKKLDLLRENIDDVDGQLIHLLAKRSQLSREVGLYKKEHKLAPVQNNRWEELLRSRIEQGEQLGIDPTFIQNIYKLIHEESVRIQNSILNDSNV